MGGIVGVLGGRQSTIRTRYRLLILGRVEQASPDRVVLHCVRTATIASIKVIIVDISSIPLGLLHLSIRFPSTCRPPTARSHGQCRRSSSAPFRLSSDNRSIFLNYRPGICRYPQHARPACIWPSDRSGQHWNRYRQVLERRVCLIRPELRYTFRRQ